MSVPPFPRSRSALALVVATCAAAPALGATAAAQSPDPGSLWKAYPLSPRTTAPAERPTGDPLQIQAPGSREPIVTADEKPDHTSVPLSVSIAFYAGLAALAALLVAAAVPPIARRRARPVTCEITFSPGTDGDAFMATSRSPGREERLVALSPRFPREPRNTPEYDAASHAAYEKLLDDLYADGWLPYELGRQWWETRLRRPTKADKRTPAGHA